MIIIKQEKTLITQTHGKVGRFHIHQKRHFPYPLAFLRSPRVLGLLAKTNRNALRKKTRSGGKAADQPPWEISGRAALKTRHGEALAVILASEL